MPYSIDENLVKLLKDIPKFEFSLESDDILDLPSPSSSSSSSSTSSTSSYQDVRFNSILQDIASKGTLPDNLEWNILQNLLAYRISSLLDEYFQRFGFQGPLTESYDEKKNRLLILLFSSSYNTSPPFSIQRLVELLVDHTINLKIYYKSTNTLMNAFIKILSVDRTIEEVI